MVVVARAGGNRDVGVGVVGVDHQVRAALQLQRLGHNHRPRRLVGDVVGRARHLQRRAGHIDRPFQSPRIVGGDGEGVGVVARRQDDEAGIGPALGPGQVDRRRVGEVERSVLVEDQGDVRAFQHRVVLDRQRPAFEIVGPRQQLHRLALADGDGPAVGAWEHGEHDLGQVQHAGQAPQRRRRRDVQRGERIGNGRRARLRRRRDRAARRPGGLGQAGGQRSRRRRPRCSGRTAPGSWRRSAAKRSGPAGCPRRRSPSSARTAAARPGSRRWPGVHAPAAGRQQVAEERGRAPSRLTVTLELSAAIDGRDRDAVAGRDLGDLVQRIVLGAGGDAGGGGDAKLLGHRQRGGVGGVLHRGAVAVDAGQVDRAAGQQSASAGAPRAKITAVPPRASRRKVRRISRGAIGLIDVWTDDSGTWSRPFAQASSAAAGVASA